MTTKDYVYLGLILLTALAFYCNGFYAGVYRCKRIYDSLMEESETDSAAVSPPETDKYVGAEDKAFDTSFPARQQPLPLSSHDLRGDFRNN